MIVSMEIGYLLPLQSFPPALRMEEACTPLSSDALCPSYLTVQHLRRTPRRTLGTAAMT